MWGTEQILETQWREGGLGFGGELGGLGSTHSEALLDLQFPYAAKLSIYSEVLVHLSRTPLMVTEVSDPV